MGSVNKVILLGNLGADPEIRRTQDGRPIANMRLATSEHWRDKNSGERREKTEWHTVVCFNEGLCKVIEQYLGKGDTIYVEGQMQTRKWQDNEGKDRYSTEVVMQAFQSKLVMIKTKRDAGDRGDDQSSSSGGAPQQTSGGYGSHRSGDALDDEIPF